MDEVDFFETLDGFHGGVIDVLHNHIIIYNTFFKTRMCRESIFCKNYFKSQCIFFSNISRYFNEYKRYQDIPIFNSLKKYQSEYHILESFKHCEGGIVKRLDETREFFEYLVKNVPDVVLHHPLLLQYLSFQDEFLTRIIKETNMESSLKLRDVTYTIPEKTFTEVLNQIASK